MIAILLLAPLWAVNMVFLVEIVLGLAPSRRKPVDQRAVRIAVLIPAHNEEGGIREIVEGLRAVSPPGTRHMVVAHNCSDRTAEEARAGGAEVVILDRLDERGKGFALAFGQDCLADDPPEVVIVIDADCMADAGSIERLAHTAISQNRAVQSCYLFRSRPSDSAMVQISNLAILVKNLIRQRGSSRIGAPAVMTGSGMAFPWMSFASLDLATGNIVEDLAIGLELVRAKSSPIFEEHARIWSTPSSLSGTKIQRSRWEGGFMATARKTAVPLLLQGIARLSWKQTWAALHLLVPPLTVLLIANILVWVIFGIFDVFGGPDAPLVFSSAMLGAILIAVIAAWAIAGRSMLTARILLRLPLYIVWKLALYTPLAFRKGAPGWVRTERMPGNINDIP